jgi:catechol 2,3-dioxygenase-like lactoylglutathione lyase family enzyme
LAVDDEDIAMEHVIDGLLTDFEAGKLSRRQLIRSLTTAAMAAVPALSASAQTAASIPPRRDPAPWKTVWLDHISYSVSDYRKSTAFYRDLMGWEIRHDNGRNQCSMNIGSVGGIIIRNNRRAAGDDGGSAARGGQPRITGVIDHVSWGIEPWDTDKVKAELERRGLKPRPDMVGGDFKSFHVKDPDGWDLQISNQRDTQELF